MAAGAGPPETRYVSVGDAHVAYQVIGEGPQDLLYFYGLGSHLDICWDSPVASEFMMRLASFSRLIVFDRRGTGASDGVPLSAMPTWEEWTEDILAVLDAAWSRQAAIFATLDAGPIAILFAAAHPERVSALVLMSTTARYVVADDYPAGASQEMVDTIVEIIESKWGTTDFVDLINPSMAENPEFARFVAKMLRASATPRTAAALYNYILRTLDVRAALPMVQAPTLVLHAKDDPIVPIEHGRFLVDHIGDARLITLPGAGPGVSPANYSLADEVAEFLTGERPTIQVERILTTVLFTDIVGSTQHAAQVGDRRWRSLLDSHDRVVREQLSRFDGREVKTTGDGFLAAFDGPGRAIRCAAAITKGTETLGIPVRTGLHTGECEVRGEDLGGLAVHIAARVGALAAPGEVLVSRTVADLVAGSGIEFQDRGAHELKGVPSTWNLFAVQC